MEIHTLIRRNIFYLSLNLFYLYFFFLLKTPAKRVASISEIEDRIYNRMKSKSMRELLTQRLSAFSSSSLMNLVTGIGSLGDTRQYHSDGTKVRKIEKGVQVSMEEKKDIGKRSLQYVKLFFNVLSLIS